MYLVREEWCAVIKGYVLFEPLLHQEACLCSWDIGEKRDNVKGNQDVARL